MQQTEDAVLASARKCFGRTGYRKTSVDEIAVDAGVAKGTVYLYCSGKRDLFVRALVSEVEAWADAMRAIAERGNPADETLIDMGLHHRNFVEEHPLVVDLLRGEIDAVLPEQRARLNELRVHSRNVVADVLRRGIGEGVFNADIDPDVVADVLQDMQVAGAVLRHHSNLSLAAVRKRQAATVMLVLDGLRARPRKRSRSK